MSTINDKQEIDELCKKFFAAFDNSGKLKLAGLRNLFIKEAVVIKNSGPGPEIYDLDAFIGPREKLLTDGSLMEFSERELDARTDIFGNIAQRFCAYQKKGILDGKPFKTEGMKTIQFIRTPAGWKICAVSWDDEREGLQIPREF